MKACNMQEIRLFFISIRTKLSFPCRWSSKIASRDRFQDTAQYTTTRRVTWRRTLTVWHARFKDFVFTNQECKKVDGNQLCQIKRIFTRISPARRNHNSHVKSYQILEHTEAYIVTMLSKLHDSNYCSHGFSGRSSNRMHHRQSISYTIFTVQERRKRSSLKVLAKN
jgi:hypothetical protein